MVKKPKIRPRKGKLSLPPTSIQSIFRHLKPNWRAYMHYVRHAAVNGDKEMDKLLAVHKGLNLREQASITPEYLCELAGVKPGVLVGSVVASVIDVGRQEAEIVVGHGYPGVVSTMVRSAAKVKGVKDREFILKHTGFTPMPKGSQINIPIDARHVSVGTPAVLPSMDQDMLQLEAVEDEGDTDAG